MRAPWRQSTPWQLGWAVLLLAGTLTIVRVDIAQRRSIFQDQARSAHRLVSQQAAQLEAVLATLVLISAPRPHFLEGPQADGPTGPEQRLPALYPQQLAVMRHDTAHLWPDPAFNAAEERSRAARRAVLGPVDLPSARYVLLQAGSPLSFALRIEQRALAAVDKLKDLLK